MKPENLELKFKKEAEAEIKPYGVSEITRLIKNRLESEFASIWVEGELSKALDHPSGHLYMTLKENNDVLDVTMWRSSRKNLKFKPEPGMQVLVMGRVSAYGPYGKYQLIAERLEPYGVGALQIKFEQLKKKLAAKGYFDENRKKPIPEYPEVVGVVTSPSGAAVKDIIGILRRRSPGVRIILAPVLVEGSEAAPQIAEAIDDFNRYGKADVLIAGRGGGSPESLWAFNEEIVADAIFRSKIPIISAVGHEIDFTIADFVADLRASTPSAAAELAVKDKKELLKNVDASFKRMSGVLLSIIKELKNRVRDLAKRPVMADPARFLEDGRRRVDENMLRITNAVKRNSLSIKTKVNALAKHLRVLKPSLMIKRQHDKVSSLQKELQKSGLLMITGRRQRLVSSVKRLNTLSPRNVLERGYSITRKENGEVVRDESQLLVGEAVDILFHKGGIKGRVEQKFTGDKKK